MEPERSGIKACRHPFPSIGDPWFVASHFNFNSLLLSLPRLRMHHCSYVHYYTLVVTVIIFMPRPLQMANP